MALTAAGINLAIMFFALWLCNVVYKEKFSLWVF